MEEITWGNTLSVVLTGLVVVFAALVILIFLVWLMGKIFIAIGNKKTRNRNSKNRMPAVRLSRPWLTRPRQIRLRQSRPEQAKLRKAFPRKWWRQFPPPWLW